MVASVAKKPKDGIFTFLSTVCLLSYHSDRIND
jgi:hypothetical protein